MTILFVFVLFYGISSIVSYLIANLFFIQINSSISNIVLMSREFTSGLEDRGSIPGRLKKWYLIPRCLKLSIIRYVSRVKWSNPGNRVAPSSTPWCSSY